MGNLIQNPHSNCRNGFAITNQLPSQTHLSRSSPAIATGNRMLQLALCTNLHQPFAHAVLSKSSALRQSFRSKWIYTKQSKIARPKKSGIKPDDANSDQTTLRWGVRSPSSCPSLHSCLSFQRQHTKTCTNGIKFHGKTFHLFLKTCKCSFEDKLHQRSQNRCQIPWLQKGCCKQKICTNSRKLSPIFVTQVCRYDLQLVLSKLHKHRQIPRPNRN